MLSYVLRRLLYAIPILFGVLLITFVLFRVVQPPEKIAITVAGPKASQAMKDAVIKKYNLDKPLKDQFVIYLKDTVRFEFNDSFKRGRPVADIFKDGIWPTLLITLPGFA